MSDRKILFIVEGKSEEEFINKSLNKFLKLDEHYEVVQYKTSIYELYDLIKENEDLSLTAILLLNNKIDPKLSNRYQLDSTFAYIYLIFDLDMQYQKFSCEKIEYMAKRFSDPTEEGQLIINFPMFESLYDCSKDFNIKDVNRFVDKMSSDRYRKMVKTFSYAIINNQFHKYLKVFVLFKKVAELNQKRYLTLNKYKEYLGIDTYTTFESVMNIYGERNKIFVLNMMILLYFEFNNNSVILY